MIKNFEKTTFSREKVKMSVRNHLERLKLDKDEIPERIIHSTDEDNLYKVRKMWWQDFIANLRIFNEFINLDNNLKEEIEQFITKYKSDSFKKRLTTDEDIKDANSLMGKVLDINF